MGPAMVADASFAAGVAGGGRGVLSWSAMSEPEARDEAPPLPFPRVFLVANSIELLERLAYYGVAVNLATYLIETVGFSDVENGDVMGQFSAARAFLPLAAGALADRLGFRRSLVLSFVLYSLAYSALFAAPTRSLARIALFGIAFAGAFLKPVITGTVKRYSPPGRQTEGFAIFYRMVNSGSVVGKIIAKNVRTLVSLRATFITSIVASLVALVVTLVLYFEPKSEADPSREGGTPPYRASAEGGGKGGGVLSIAVETVKDYATALKNRRLAAFLLVVSGYYLLIEQFYQTFPIYMARQLPSAPREYITLINPLSIAILQIVVARATRKLDPLGAMACGIGIGAVSMLTMGLFPTIPGAACSFFIFALAEMVFSPRYYDYVSSFAPKGKEGLYMGLALAPFGVGGLIGGVLSGRLIARYIPANGPREPLTVWGTYAAIGVGCALILGLYRLVVNAKRA
jgi:proton-dependent oligopeptide transporter, POT family